MTETVFCLVCTRLRVVASSEEKPVPESYPDEAVPMEGQLTCGHRARWISAR